MKPLLEVCNLGFSYGAREVLTDISFCVKAGEFISLIGANGSGKSTLIKLLSKEEQPDQGSIRYKGRELCRLSVMELAREVAVLHQNGDIAFPFTCMELVWMGRYPVSRRFERHSREARDFICHVMELTECLKLADQPVDEISGGELQRVMLARALAQEPELLLLDEAMSDFDIAVKLCMSELLQRLVRQGLTVIAVNHDLPIAYRCSDRVIALHKGKIAADGPTGEVFTGELLKTIFGVGGEVVPGKGIFFSGWEPTDK